MKLYLVRHGESTANVSRIHQTPEEELTEDGKHQVVQVGERFKDISIEKIISSPFKRALLTAEEIKKNTGVEIETSEVFREVKRPSEFHGKLMEAPVVKEVFREMISHDSEPDWHYSDEENFYDLKKRAQDAISFLEKQTAEEIAVVTHSVFMRMLIGVVTFGEHMSPQILRDLGNHFKINNTGITLLNFEKETNDWRLLTWNDYAHLG